MDTLVDRARSGPAGAKARQGLTDAKLRDLPPREQAYKVSDGGNGLYVCLFALAMGTITMLRYRQTLD